MAKAIHSMIRVLDEARSVAFYEDAFGLTRRFVHEAGMYAEMDTGATTLAFAASMFFNHCTARGMPC